jgi:hypothetical protein
MLAAKPSRKTSAVWQGLTKDSYTLRLTRSVLTQIISKLKQTGLEHLVKSNNKGNLEAAVVVSIAQVVNHANASGTVSSQEFGRNLLAFTAIGKTRKYQILTQPIDSKQGAIIFIRSEPSEISREWQQREMEYDSELEIEFGRQEIEYMDGGKGDKNGKRPLRAKPSPIRIPSPSHNINRLRRSRSRSTSPRRQSSSDIRNRSRSRSRSASPRPGSSSNPWTSPGGTVRAKSPGGRTYRQMSPAGDTHLNNRDAAGYKNPPHDHPNMLPLWKKAALSPIPSGLDDQALTKHLMNKKDRHFRATSPGGSRERIIRGHHKGVLGHRPSAGEDWNARGHRRSRSENLQHNQQTSTFHGIEDRKWSAQSGSKEARYLSPGPHLGSHRSHWDRNDPNFTGGKWHSYERDSSRSSSPDRERSRSRSASSDRERSRSR